jgi:TRAP transporter TAXI family solute receptor
VPTRRNFLGSLPAAACALLAACDPREYARRHGATMRLSIAAGNVGGIYYPYGGAIAAVITKYVDNVAATAEVTGGSIDNMHFIRQGTADLGLSTADMLSEAFAGTGQFASTGRVPVCALAVLYTNYIHVVTLDPGIRELGDLRGKVISVGAAGSSTEIGALRILRAAGIDPDRDVTRQGLGVGPSADALRDGKIHAMVWSGGLPTGPILEVATMARGKMRILPTASVVPELQRAHGASTYFGGTIPRGTYPGLDEDIAVVAMANVLAVDARMNDDLVYEITSALFGHTDELAAVHSEARSFSPATAVKGSPIEFHPGAIRFYAERGVWTN